MKIIVAAFALAIAAPAAAAQPAQSHAEHRQHGGHQGHGQGQHQGHGQGQGQHQGHGPGQHQGHGEGCPCCAPGRAGQRPACCERMHGQHAPQNGQPQGAQHDSR